LRRKRLQIYNAFSLSAKSFLEKYLTFFLKLSILKRTLKQLPFLLKTFAVFAAANIHPLLILASKKISFFYFYFFKLYCLKKNTVSQYVMNFPLYSATLVVSQSGCKYTAVF